MTTLTGAEILQQNATLFVYLMPIVLVLGFIMAFFTQIFPQTEYYERLKAWVNHECWHNWVKMGPTGKLYHCVVCRIELHEDNYHPWIKYKCSKCGKETDEADNMQLLKADGSPQEEESC